MQFYLIASRSNWGEPAMILGMSLETFTILHVIISLIGIVSGLVVVYGMLSGHASAGITALFLASTVLTSATGFLFPADKLLPSHVVGIISLVVLAIALAALYAFRLAGAWPCRSRSSLSCIRSRQPAPSRRSWSRSSP